MNDEPARTPPSLDDIRMIMGWTNMTLVPGSTPRELEDLVIAVKAHLDKLGISAAIAELQKLDSVIAETPLAEHMSDDRQMSDNVRDHGASVQPMRQKLSEAEHKREQLIADLTRCVSALKDIHDNIRTLLLDFETAKRGL